MRKSLSGACFIFFARFMRSCAIFTAVAAAGCSSQVPATNQFDPSGTGPKATAKVSGQVMLENRVDWSGIAILITDAAGARVDGGLVTGSDGRFISTDIQPGVISVVIDIPTDYIALAVPQFELLPGEQKDLGVLFGRLAPMVGVIAGQVILEESADSPRGVVITATHISGESPVPFTGIADDSGAYLITGLPAGDYEIRANQSGFTPDLLDWTIDSTRAEGPKPLRLYPAAAVALFRTETADGTLLGAKYTNNQTVSLLLLEFGGINEMRLSESSAMVEGDEDVPWREFILETAVGLSDGEGEKTIYAQFRVMSPGRGERLRTEAYPSQIIYDASPPEVLEFSLNGGADFLTGDDGIGAAAVEFLSQDALSGVTAFRTTLEQTFGEEPFQALDSTGNFLSYRFVLSLGDENGTKTLLIQTRDRAGNVSETAAASIFRDTVAPAVGTPPFTLSEEIDGSVNTPFVTLAFDVSGDRVDEPLFMAVANTEGLSVDSNFIRFESPYGHTLAAGADGDRKVCAIFRDAAGLVSGQHCHVTRLDTTGSIAGRIALEDETGGYGGTLVEVWHTASATTIYSTPTDETGTYLLADIPSGPGYMVRYTHPAHVTQSASGVVIFTGTVAALGTASLKLPRASIEGQIKLAGLEAGQWGGIGVFDANYPQVAVTNPNGQFILRDILAGAGYTYNLRVSFPGYAQGALPTVTNLVNDEVKTLAALELVPQQQDFTFCAGDDTVACLKGPILYTGSRTVGLNLSNTLGFLRMSQSSDFSDTPEFSAYDPGVLATFEFAAEEPDGIKNIYVHFDGDGSCTLTACDEPVLGGAVILDTTPPQFAQEAPVIIDPDGSGTGSTYSTHPSGDVSVRLSATDAGSGIARVTLVATTDPMELPVFIGTADEEFFPDLQLSLDESVPGLHFVYAELCDAVLNCTAIAGVAANNPRASIIYDADPPANSTLTINGGDSVTALGVVTVEIYTGDAVAYRISENPLLAGAQFADAIADSIVSSQVVLSPGDGEKTLYGQFTDAAGNTTDLPSAFSATIKLDTQGPSITAFSVDGGGLSPAFTPNDQIDILGISFSDNGDCASLEVSEDRGFTGSITTYPCTQDWATETAYVLGDYATDGTRDGLKTLFARATDSAGNRGSVSEVLVTLDTQPPFAQASAECRSCVEAPGATYYSTAGTGEVAILVSAADAGSGIDHMEISIDGAAAANYSFIPLQNIFVSTTAGSHNVDILFVDRAGLAQRAPTLQLVLDGVSPTIDAFDFSPPAGSTNSTQVSLNLAASDSGSQVSRFALFNSDPGSCDNANWLVFDGSSIDWTFAGGRVYACIRDAAHNTGGPTATASSKVIDTAQPSNATLTLASSGGYLKSSSVAATLSASDGTGLPTEFFISGDIDLTDGTDDGGEWLTYAVSASVTLNAGEGRKILTVIYRDAAGNTSMPVSKSVTVDVTAPSVNSVVIGNGGVFITSLATTATVQCADNLALDSELALVVGDDDFGGTNYSGSYVVTVPITLEATEQGKTATATCTDPAGNSAGLTSGTFYLDTSAPTIAAVSLNGGGVDEPTSSQTVTVNLALSHSPVGGPYGIESVALAESAAACASAQYVYPPAATVNFVVSAGDALKDMWACARDNAGNVTSSPTQSSNRVLLDTAAPGAGTIDLASGRILAANPVVAFEISGGTADLLIAITGDLTAVGADVGPWVYWNSTTVDGDGVGGIATLPLAQTLTLTAGDGLKTVRATFQDAAGNTSGAFFDTLTLDQTAPTLGFIRIGGQEWTSPDLPIVVFQPQVTAEILPADGDSAFIEISEVASDLATCDVGADACLAITANQVFALSAAPGVKSLYYRFFDNAGNGSVASGEFQVQLTVSRPLPVLDYITPNSLLALQESSYSIMFVGQKFADDTIVRVGDFEIAADCSLVGIYGATTCTASTPEADSCDGVPACRNCCEIILDPSSPAWQLTSLSGSYLSRMITPTPVVGTGVSLKAQILNIVAPYPKVAGLTVINGVGGSCLLGVLDDCAFPFHDVWSLEESAAPQDFHVLIWGSDLMDNASVRLESTFAQTIYAGPLYEGGTSTRVGLIAKLSSVFLSPRDLPYDLSVINPSPGGGELILPFGVNWSRRLVTSSSPSTIWPTDFITRTKGVFQERYGNPGYDPIDDDLTVSDSLFVSAPGHTLVALNPAGEILYRLTTDERGLGLPLGISPLEFAISGAPGPSIWVIKEGALAAPTGAFGAQTPYPVGVIQEYFSNSFALDAGDINGDGNVDVVVSNSGEDDLEIFIGDGSGVLTKWVTVFTGQTGGVTRIVDLNGDGVLDIAVAGSSSSSGLNILINKGGGQFDRIGPFDAGYLPYYIHPADFNGDGVVDLLTAGANASIFLGTGGGYFAARFVLPTAASWPTSAGIGDVDADGNLDVVTANGLMGTISVYLGKGDATFYPETMYPIGDLPEALHLADMNHDGVLDVVVANESAGVTFGEAVTIALGLGDGSFASPVKFSLSPDATNHAEVGDFDGDGNLDVATYGGFKIKILLGQGDGTLVAGNTYAIGGWARRLLTHDINGDGVLDILWSNELTLNTRLGQSTSVVRPVDFAMNNWSRESTVADWNKDLFPDLALAEQGGIQVFLNDAASVLGTPTLMTDPGGSPSDELRSVESGDFNRDQNNDIIALNYTSPALIGFYGNGAGAFPTTYRKVLADVPERLVTLDANHDGYLDVAVSYDQFTNKVGVFLQGFGGTFGAEIVLAMPEAVVDLTALDADADGNIDLAFVTGGDGYRNLRIALGLGDGTFVLHPLSYVTGWYAPHVGTADMNVDGHPDLVVMGTYDITVFLGDSTGVFTALPSTPTLQDPRGYEIADFTQDGIPDIANSSQDELVAVFEGVGDGTLGQQVQYRTGIDWRLGSLSAADFNRDGVTDLAMVDGYGAGVRILTPAAPQTPVRQALTSLPLASIPIDATGAATTVAATRQASQDLTGVSVFVQVSFSSLPTGTLLTKLIAPDNREINLGSHTTFTPWPNAAAPTRWRLSVSYPTTAAIDNLGDLVGVMPSGYWALEVTNDTDTAGELTGFTVSTLGRVYGPFLGDRGDHALTIRWDSAELGARVMRDTLIGYTNLASMSCEVGSIAPDHHYDFTLTQTRKVTVEVVASYDSVVELRNGPCSATTGVVACNDNWVGSNSRVVAADQPPGDFCAIVDGNGASAGGYVVRVILECPTGQHLGGPNVCVAVGTCSIGYALDGGGECTLCATGYHDGGLGACVLEGQCSTGFVDGGDGSCVGTGTCSTGYHDGGTGLCVANGTCSTGYAVDAGGDCTLCDTGYHDGGDGFCVLLGVCSPGYHDGGDGSCTADGTCAPGYHDDGQQIDNCVLAGSCAAGYSNGGFGNCLLDGNCESTHIYAGGNCATCIAEYTANTSGQCLLTGLACPADDAYEPNDNGGEEWDITGLTAVDAIYCTADFDWYIVNVPAGCAINVWAYFSHAEGNLDLATYDIPAGAITFSQSVDDNEHVIATTSGTTIDVIAFVAGGAPGAVPYRLEYGFDCP